MKKISQQPKRPQNSGGEELRNRDNNSAEQPESQQDPNIISLHKRQITMTRPVHYSDDVYLQYVTKRESQHDYDHQIEECVDYLKPNDEYLTPSDVDYN